MLYQNIADEEITAGESASFIIAQLKAFGTEFEKIGDVGSQAVYVIDAVNEVSNTSAVSSAQLAESLGKVSATLSANNVKFSESLGMLTAITEISRNANTASRGLKMISSRLVQINDESSSTGKKLREIYDGLGIGVYDANGQLRSTFDILKDLSKQWGDLDTNTQQYIALTSAGANQIQNFYALMSNFSTAINATATAEKSMGSAWRENAKYMESVEAKYQALKTAIEDLVLGDGGITKLIKNVLDLSTKLVNFANKAGGLTSILGVLASTLVLLNTSSIVKFVLGLNTLNTATGTATFSLKNFIVELVLGKGATDSLSASTATLASTTAIATAGISLAIGVVTVALGALIRQQEKIEEETKENIKSIENEIDKLSSLSESLDNENLTREQLNSLIEDTSLAYDEELSKIEDVNEARQRAIELLEEEKRTKAEELVNTGKTQYEEAKRALVGYNEMTGANSGFNYYSGGGWGLPDDLRQMLTSKGLNYDMNFHSDTLEGYIEELNKYLSVLNSYGTTNDKVKAQVDHLTSELLYARDVYNENIEIVRNYENALKSIGYVYDETNQSVRKMTEQDYIAEAQKELQKYGVSNYNVIQAVGKEAYATGKSIEELAKKYDKNNNSVKDAIEIATDYLNQGILTQEQYEKLTEVISESEDGTIDFATACEEAGIDLEEITQSIGSFTDILSDWNSSLDSMQETYETLSGAIEEYNTNGFYSVDTLQSLLNLEPEYLEMLEESKGSIDSLNEAMQLKIQNHIEDGKALIYEETAERLETLAKENAKKASEDETSATENNTSATETNTQVTLENANAHFRKALATARDSDATKEEIDSIIDDMNRQLKLLDNMATNTGRNFGKAMKSAESSARGAKEETNKLRNEVDRLKNSVESIKKELEEYKTVISTIEDALDKEIEKIEKERDTKVDSIEEQIKNLEELQNKEEKYWDEKIQALQDENDAIEEQIELENLLKALETAKNTKVKVYKEGEGFTWVTDQDAVNKAQKDIDEYNRKRAYEQKLKELEDFKKKALDNYEGQINDLKKYEEEVKKQYDEQIKHFQDIKDKFKQSVDEYEREQNNLLVLQKTGINLEDENWTKRLGNLDDFLAKYKEKLKELEKAQEELNKAQEALNNTPTPNTGGNDGGNYGNNNGNGKTHYFIDGKEVSENQYLIEKGKQNQTNSKIDEANKPWQEGLDNNPNLSDTMKRKYQEKIDENNKGRDTRVFSTKVYSRGTSSVKSNEFAIVGENPYKEIVIGSALNNGVGMSLSKGTGVVNSKSTNTLAGIINLLGSQFDRASLGNYSNNTNNTSSINNITISNISLPNVQNGNDFVEYLKDFSNLITQKAYSAI